MKIVDVAEFYTDRGGGVRTYINQKLRAASRSGHAMVVIAPGLEDRREERHGGVINWVKGPAMPVDSRYRILWREKAVHRILDREAPDVVEGSSPWAGGWFTARWRGRAVKTFVLHQEPVSTYPQTLLGRTLGEPRVDRASRWLWAYLRNLSSRFDATVAGSRWAGERLRLNGIRKPRVMMFGVEKDRFSPEKGDGLHRRSLLASCGLGEDAALLLAVGRLSPEKRMGTLMSAFEIARSRRPMGLVVYGDGPLMPWLRHWAARVPGVHLAGHVRDRNLLARSLASADALVHAGAAETYGMVVAEAICSGLPVVVCDRGGVVDIAEPGCAETYSALDANECARAIWRLLERDRDDLAAGCRRTARTKIRSTEDHFRALFRLYDRLLRARR